MMSEISYSSIKMSHHIREVEEKKAAEKKRQLLYLIHHYLREEGYFETVRSFTSEAQLNNQYEVCDNVDLGNIVQDYEAYYFLRFQKYPKICKKLTSPPEEKDTNLKKKVTSKRSTEIRSAGDGCRSGSTVSKDKSNTQKPFKNDFTVDLTVLPISNNANENKNISNEEWTGERILKPLGGFSGYTGEWKEFAESITKEICMTNLNVCWDDIMGLEEAKRLLKEAVVYPIKYPELFSGVLAPWKGLLLYGPPGTGKTLLAKAVATTCRTTFFNISASSIVSKWRGDSEKLVRVLFELARYHAPSTIFLDEIDALASHRDGIGEHEGSRRLKAELLIQLDGLAHSDDRVFLLATSNLPWELDAAILRRLEKRILVDLPTVEAREAMIHHYLPPIVLKEPALHCRLDYHLLAMTMEGYSGSDIKLVCKEAAMEAMRQVFSVLEDHDNKSSLPKLQMKAITTQDVAKALRQTQPSAAHLAGKYQKWQKEFGSI